MREMVRRIRAAALLLPFIFLMTSCWDRTELNDMAFALSSAVDKEPDGTYRVSYMLPLPGQMGGASGGGGGTGGTESYYIDSETGVSTREADAKLQKRMSRQLFVAHRRTVLIGEEMAREGISEVFDSMPRIPESRLSTYIVITKGPAWKLLNTKPKFERFPAEVIRELAKAPGMIKINAKDIAAALSFNSDPIIVYMGEKKSEKADEPSREVEVIGYAQMKGDKMVGVFDSKLTQGLMWVRQSVKEYTAVLTEPKEKKPIILDVSQGNSHITPVLAGDGLHLKLDLEASAQVRENFSSLDMNETSDLHAVEAMLSSDIKEKVVSALKLMQKRGTDSAQIGNLVWRKYPAEWYDRLERSWHEEFVNAKFDVEVKSGITEAGVINQNVTRRSY